MENNKKALSEIAQEFRWTVDNLEKDPLKKAYVLREVDEHIRKIVEDKYSNNREALFLMFFYANLRYHLWMHVAGDASLKITDSQTKRIIQQIKSGLNELAESLERDDKAKIYNALVNIIFNYLNELNKEDVEND